MSQGVGFKCCLPKTAWPPTCVSESGGWPSTGHGPGLLGPGQVGGQAVLGRQQWAPTPWLTERHGYE